ncbi:O-antigen ligase family protein [Caulobacter sp.]|uniref:O-antigen ligase family protein n=1 Tax=Caulobacter sp. TaxID=78 RepID=UPI003BB1F4F2
MTLLDHGRRANLPGSGPPCQAAGPTGQVSANDFYSHPIIDVWFALTLTALFFGQIVGPGKAFLFVAMSAVAFVAHIPLLLRPGELRKLFNLPLFIFLAIHVGFAMRVSMDIFQLKLIQVVIVLGFTWSFVVRYSRYDMRRFYRWAAIFLVATIAVTILYHISIHRYVTWKYLADTKNAFALLPFVLVAFLTGKSPAARRYGALAVLVSAVLILMSGERKGYIMLALALPLILNFRNPLTYLAPLILIAAIPALEMLDSTGYIQRQVESLVHFGRDSAPKTFSTMQREWTANYVKTIIPDHPLIGVGTNGYGPIVQDEYRSAFLNRNGIINPGLGIHGEPTRILVENGAVGVLAVLSLLVYSALNIMRSWVGPMRRYRTPREKLLAAFLMGVLLIHMAAEAWDSTMMLAYCLVGYLSLLRLDSIPRAPARVPTGQGVVPFK